jgi:cytoskeletal protein RodZ
MAITTLGAPAPSRPNPMRTLNLAVLRQKKGLSLEQIIEKTKISGRFLRAIESENFEQLPGGIFATSYLRQYAACIGMDEQEILAHFEEKMNPALPPAPEPAETRTLFDRWFRLRAPAEPSRP